MIKPSELNPKNYPTSDEVKQNLEDLLIKMNQVRVVYGKPMIVTSGLRSEADQKRINPAAPKSNHLTGRAVDIYDADGSLYRWCKSHEELLTNLGLWMEERQGPWQHFQSVPPKSGKRWFNP